MPPRGVGGHRGVQHGDQRQRRRAQRRQPVQPQHGQVGERHESPAGQARAGRQRGRRGGGPAPESREPDDRPGGRQSVDHQQPGDRRSQQPRRVVELDVGGPGHHPPQVGESRVGTDAHHAGRQAEPAASSLPLDHAAERHVVDAGSADRRQPAGPVQRLPADQHAAPGRRGRARPGRVHPGERIELSEEVDERRDHDALPGRGRPQQRHLRDQIPVIRLGCADQGPQRTGVPGDIGVGEQHVPGSLRVGPVVAGRRGRRQAGRVQPLGHGPHLPGPARRQRRARDHSQRPGIQARLGPEFRRDLGGAVRTAVVDHDDRERARVVLAEQRRQHGRQHRGLVPGRDDRYHIRPPGRLARQGEGARGEPLAGPPVAAVPDGQVGPCDRGHRARDAQRQHPGSLSQAGGADTGPARSGHDGGPDGASSSARPARYRRACAARRRGGSQHRRAAARAAA